ncbi:50S ribosomal protein L1, partial [Candidatus Saccharibacteria bacterium]|nr:50S ribosomal protein L1 [Candidatus Saccharibacteria bacterium]
MAKKAELLEKAAELKLEVSEKNTIAEIEAAIAGAEKHEVREAAPAKAGKRSEKALKEAEEKAEKEARKEAGDTTPQGDTESHVKKGPAPKVRSKLERRGKNYRNVAGKVEADKVYSLADALALAVETNPVKFDASVEVHVRMGVDPRQADQNIRATVSLPHGTGKKIRVAVFAPEAEEKKKKKAELRAARKE